MKKTIIAFFNKPLIVIVVSLLIAIPVAIVVTKNGTAASAQQYAQAVSGVIGDTQQNHITLGFLTSGRILNIATQVGQTVKKDDVLASLDPQNTQGALTQAQAALDAATANYQKVLNGATGPTVDAAKAALNTAQVALSQATHQQNLLVENAYSALLNVAPAAYPKDAQQFEDTAPTITGSYTLGTEGDLVVTTFASAAASHVSFTLSGMISGSGEVTSVTAQPLGNSGLYIQFPSDAKANRTWVISIPNTKASDYITKYNAYQSALQTRTQVLATAKAAVDQAQSNLALVMAAARPEDISAAQAQVENAKGTLQIAQAAYDNTLLRAPQDSVVTAIHISQGEIAVPNAPAIELSGVAQSKQVSVMVPLSSIITRNDKQYVVQKTNAGNVEREVTAGVSDAHNAEILSGIAAGDIVAIQQ